MKVNGEAIYESQIWTVQNDTITSGVWYTERNGAVYATVLNWPEANTLTLSPVELFQATTNVRLLGYEDEDISVDYFGIFENVLFISPYFLVAIGCKSCGFKVS